ncbi:MAG: preprotein translocase subunit YajC [Pseudomonadota bacterium]
MSILAILISTANAQDAAAPAPNPIMSFVPFILIMVVFYFLIIRPQQQQRKKHQEMVAGVKRGDIVVTSGGLVGKVTKASDDAEIQVEIADGVQVTVMKGTLADVRAKTEPAAANNN